MNTMRRQWFALLATLLAGIGAFAPASALGPIDPELQRRDRSLLEARFATLAPQRPGKTDLYVIGFGGDSTEDVFRNEVMYLEALMRQRFGARDRVVSLINHADSMTGAQTPLASLQNLRRALHGVAETMNPEEDVLLLFMTMHGTAEHFLVAQMPPLFQELIDPKELRAALDDAGIRHRVIVISACYSGGFVKALSSPDTLVLTASRHDRTSFGCGPDSEATYFGRAWMIEGLNSSADFVTAFEDAKKRINAREKADDFEPSLPQISIGANIRARLGHWRDHIVPGPPVPYPYDAPATPSNDETDARAAAKAPADGSVHEHR
ncbi:MAG: peptidase C13 [Lysobacteraceae bacterium]|nr:MAG: peptidase C13 [Xanthomonadaceae bacterium]